MKPQPSVAQTPAPGRLDPKEWNFDGVADPEIAACCLWEYARESAFIRDTLHRYREWWKAGGDRQAPGAAGLDRDLRRIQEAIPYKSHVFLAGCCFDRQRNWQSDDPDKPHYKYPDAPPLTGSFPDPWQSLHEGEGKARAHIGCDREALQLVPVKLAQWS